jgi:hypothetical protein
LLIVLAEPAPAESVLREAARDTRYAPVCERMAKVEFAESLVLPIKTAKGMRYRLFYYPTFVEKDSSPEEALALPAKVVAEFDLTSGSVVCSRPRDLPGELGKTLGKAVPAAATAVPYDAYEADLDRLYDGLQRLAKSYSAGASDATARKDAEEFRSLFAKYSEPGLSSTYRALSPDFWKWLDGVTDPKKPHPK